MSKTLQHLIILASLTLLLTILIWLPFVFKSSNFLGLDFSQGFNTIYRNFDGLEYVLIAKTMYSPPIFATMPQSLPAIYFTSHFPGYSLLILLASPLLGFLKSMLFVSVLFSILSVWAFYFLVRDFKLSEHPLFLSMVFLILPARWLIVRSVGSAETIFIFFTIMTFYFLLKYEATKKFSSILLVALMASLAQLTRPPGILIIVAILVFILWKIYQNKSSSFWQNLKNNLISYYPLLLVPLTLLGIFILFQVRLGDFWAYFHSGDNIHLTFPPFQFFNKNQYWVGDIWLEDGIYLFILGFLGGLLLIKQKLYSLAFFVLTYLTATIFVAHRDISRYALPIFPFLIIAFEKILVSREFKIVLAIVALGIYLYAENFLINNTAPYPNPFLFD